MTRGERNNNPGNMQPGGWEGEIGLETGVPVPRFAVFDTASNGIRALAKQLLVYQEIHGCTTVYQMISRWAPPIENYSTAYAKFVAAGMSIDMNDPITLRDDPTKFAQMVGGIIKEENGECIYGAEIIAAAIQAAL